VIVDCASVRILARLVRAWLDDGRDPVTVCPEGMVAHVLRLTGYTREFEVVPVFLAAVLVEDDPRVRFLLRSAHATA
jgi:anti-anti-sigma regulatory factor